MSVGFGDRQLIKLKVIINYLLRKIKVEPKQRYKIISILPFIFKPNMGIGLKQLEQANPFPNGSSIANIERKALKEQVDLDIIVPAYNVKNYIEQCIDSLLNQKTNYKYRIIIINDGSTDGTSKLLTSYAKNNPKLIKLINQSNKGLSGARNTGLMRSNAKYITFVDSDDFVSNTFVDDLLDKCFETNADIVEVNYETVDLSGSTIKKYKMSTTGKGAFQLLYGYPWGKAYKSNLFNGVIFPEGFWFEDTMLMYRVWPKAKRVFNIDKAVYHYRINPEGITRTARRNLKSLDSLYITIQLLRDCKKLRENLNINIYEFSLFQMVMNFHRIFFLNNDILSGSFFTMCNLLNEYFPEEDFKTQNSTLKNIEKALRSGNYLLFVNNAIAMF